MTKYPTVKLGYIKGPVRWETNGGEDRYGGQDRFLINQGPATALNTTWAITHLQKRSKFGFLWMSPFCFHVWYTFKYQEERLSDGDVMVWVPGTEKVFYARTPGYRWDAHDSTFIKTKGYLNFSLHWD